MRGALLVLLFSWTAALADVPLHFYKDDLVHARFWDSSCAKTKPTVGIFKDMPADKLKDMKIATGNFSMQGGGRRMYLGCWMYTQKHYVVVWEDGSWTTYHESKMNKEPRAPGMVDT